MTHFIPYDSPELRRGYARARCGMVANKILDNSTVPQCTECQRLIEEDAAAVQALLDEPPDPRGPVKFEPFDPLAGYRPRDGRKR